MELHQTVGYKHQEEKEVLESTMWEPQTQESMRKIKLKETVI